MRVDGVGEPAAAVAVGGSNRASTRSEADRDRSRKKMRGLASMLRAATEADIDP